MITHNMVKLMGGTQLSAYFHSHFLYCSEALYWTYTTATIQTQQLNIGIAEKKKRIMNTLNNDYD